MDLHNFIKLHDAASTALSMASPTPHIFSDAKIHDLFKGKIARTILECDFLTKQIYVTFANDEIRFNNYLRTITTIKDSLNQNIHDQEEKYSIIDSEWESAIKIAIKKNESPISSTTEKFMRLSQSHKYLTDLGLEIKYSEGFYFLDKENSEKANKIINTLCKKIGGKKILDITFHILSNEYSSKQKRFLVARALSRGLDGVHQATPWGYIIALGLKHIHIKQPNCDISVYDELITTLTHLIALSEVQIYSVWEVVYLNDNNFIRHIINSVIYDNIVLFNQVKAEYSRQIIDYIFHDFTNTPKKNNSTNLSLIVKVVRELIRLSNQKKCVHISPNAIAEKIKVQKHRVERCFEQILSFPEGSINSNLCYPPLSNDINHDYKPLYKLNRDDYLLLPSSLTGLSCLNSVLINITHPDGIFSEKNNSALGYKIENFIEHKLNEKKFNYYSGEYITKSGEKGECDLILESSEYIIFIEIKKKGLTRNAMSGVDVDLFHDLAQSVLRSQSQAFKHEYFIRKEGELILRKDETTKTIKHNDRVIIRVSLSLLDFGSLQSPDNLRKILEFSQKRNLHAVENQNEEKISLWNTYTKTINKFFRRIVEMTPHQQNPHFLDSIFMSTLQLLTLLNDSNNEEDICNKIYRETRVSYMTLDLYKNYELLEKLHNKTTS